MGREVGGRFKREATHIIPMADSCCKDGARGGREVQEGGNTYYTYG